MHTTQIDRFTFFHDGDPSDDNNPNDNIQIRRDSWDKPVYIPWFVLRDFVAEILRNRRITHLEQMTSREILGLQKEGE